MFTLTNTSPIQSALSHCHQIIFWKDHDGIYQGCNDAFSQLAGLEDPLEVIGLTDKDMPWHNREAKKYSEDDKVVVSNKQSIFNIEESVTGADELIKRSVGQKVPVQSGCEILGLLGNFMVMDTLSEFQILNMINKNDIDFLLDRYIQNSKIYDFSCCSLTNKERACLLFIVIGCSNKEIASELDISTRTVESHVETIKQKMDCLSRTQLTRKAFSLGFLERFK